MTACHIAVKGDICRRHVGRSQNVAGTVGQVLFNRKSKETS